MYKPLCYHREIKVIILYSSCRVFREILRSIIIDRRNKYKFPDNNSVNIRKGRIRKSSEEQDCLHDIDQGLDVRKKL